MTERGVSIIGALKPVGYVIAVLAGLAIAINHYVRVAAPGGKSTGVVVEWVGGLLRSDNFKNWETSAAYSGRAIDLLVRHSANIVDDSVESRQDLEKAVEYFRIALKATRKVEDEYLRDSHPLLPKAYREYEESLQLFLVGVERKDLKYIREASTLYNSFLAFMESHRNELRSIK